MKPITFSCEATLSRKPEEIASQILDLSKWPEFNGYGPLPGIKHAEFETSEFLRPKVDLGGVLGNTSGPQSIHEDAKPILGAWLVVDSFHPEFMLHWVAPR